MPTHGDMLVEGTHFPAREALISCFSLGLKLVLMRVAIAFARAKRCVGADPVRHTRQP